MQPPDRLLILDDDTCVAQTIAVIARREGFDVRTTDKTDDFFALVATWAPSHLALDLVMPGMDGVEVLRRLAERTCSARILLTSGMGAKVLESAQRSGDERGLCIAGILPKPFRAQALRDLLKDARQSSARAGIANLPMSPLSISESDLVRALENREFFLQYQPKLALATGAACGVEALVRWRHPNGTVVGPDRFVALLEKSSHIHALTDYVLDEALGWFSCLGPDLTRSLKLSINLSARNLIALQLADRLVSRCESHCVSPSALILELTESSTMADPREALDILTRLRIKGFELAIDDFGTGYSSMAQLVRLPFSELKVDKSFVLSMLHSRESYTIVASTIQLARSLGMSVVAEGIENSATAAVLVDLGCTLGQGFHLGRPMDGAVSAQWLAARLKTCA